MKKNIHKVIFRECLYYQKSIFCFLSDINLSLSFTYVLYEQCINPVIDTNTKG